jgi:hypothetical protein
MSARYDLHENAGKLSRRLCARVAPIPEARKCRVNLPEGRRPPDSMTTTFSFFCVRYLAIGFVALFFCGDFAAAQNAAAGKATVSGKFVGNGKNAAIKFVTVEEHEPFNDKEAMTLVFTEKDPKSAKKPSFDAMFGKLGSALVLNVHHDGGFFGCQVSHSAHEKQGFTSLGEIKMLEFKIANGTVSGHVSTGKELDTFGEKWEVDLTFAAPLPAKVRAAAAPATTPAKAGVTDAPASAQNASRAAREPRITARTLRLPKDAADVQYKNAVHQIHFSSARPVDVVTKEFSAKLKEQGWKESPGSLMGKQNAILTRAQGDAKLTIMIQPAPARTGSVVKIFAEGLAWDESGDPGTSSSSAAPPHQSKDDPSIDDAEAEAKKLLNDALKSLPKGF